MNVLVTGGAGFVGSYVVRELLARGDSVVLYDAAPRQNALDLVLGATPEGLVVDQGPVADSWRLLDLATRHDVEAIVHLASPLTQDVAAHPPLGIRDICEATTGIFEVARARGVRRVVWASSVAVFGRRERYPDGPVANDAPHLPENLYGACKSLCEHVAGTYRDVHGVDSVGLRLTVVYGPGRMRGYMTFPSELLRGAALGEPIHVPIADQAVNWQYVEEVAATVLHCLDCPQPRDTVFNTYGDVRTFREAAEIVARLVPDVQMTTSTEPTDAGQRTLAEVPMEYDWQELRAQTGYEPRFPLELGIERSIETFRRIAAATPLPERTAP